MSKRAAVKIALLALLVLLLAGCSSFDKWPRVTIERTEYRVDDVQLPLRDGYVFGEQMYSIQETGEGYDIVIHAVKENR